MDVNAQLAPFEIPPTTMQVTPYIFLDDCPDDVFGDENENEIEVGSKQQNDEGFDPTDDIVARNQTQLDVLERFPDPTRYASMTYFAFNMALSHLMIENLLGREKITVMQLANAFDWLAVKILSMKQWNRIKQHVAMNE